MACPRRPCNRRKVDHNMQGNPNVIQALRAALPLEAHLNLQYRMNARLLRFQGIKKAACKFSQFADDAHSWLKCVTDQLLFLSDEAGDATAAYQIDPVANPLSVTELLEGALDLEMAICRKYEENIQTAMGALDDETRNKFEHLIKWHHDHVRWIEKKIRNVMEYGEAEVILAGKL